MGRRHRRAADGVVAAVLPCGEDADTGGDEVDVGAVVAEVGERVVDVALRTSAAPTYFPAYQGYVDGGVVANNPSMAAVAQALDGRAAGRPLTDLVLLSIGAGTEPKFIKGRKVDWGWGQWARPLISMMISGVMGVADFQCRQLLGDRYFRLDHVFADGIGIIAKVIQLLAKLADVQEDVE